MLDQITKDKVILNITNVHQKYINKTFLTKCHKWNFN